MLKAFILIILFISSNLVSESLDSMVTYDEHFDIALGHYNSQRYKLAEREFKKILIDRKNYSDPVSHLMLAKSQYFQNKIIECQRTCKSYLNKYPNSKYEINVRVLISDVLIRQEKYSNVIEELLPVRLEAQDSLLQHNIDYRILSSITIGISSSKIERLLFSSENKINRSILNLARSYRSLLDGNTNDMELSLSVIEPDILPDQYKNLFNGLNHFIGAENKRHGTVAVILQLSGHD